MERGGGANVLILLLYTSCSQFVISCARDSSIKVWDINTASLAFNLNDHKVLLISLVKILFFCYNNHNSGRSVELSIHGKRGSDFVFCFQG
jgi:hypothetical protein